VKIGGGGDSLTDSEDYMIDFVRVDGDKVGGHDGEVVVVDTEDPGCVDRGVDDAKNVLLALQYVRIDHGIGRGVIPW